MKWTGALLFTPALCLNVTVSQLMLKFSAPLVLTLAFVVASCSGDTPSGGPDGGSQTDGGGDGGTPPRDGGVITSDVDMDGLDDTWEINNGLDPNRNDSGEDPDGDGLTNLVEFEGGTLPKDLDTDDDGLSDGEEDANANGQVDPGESDGLNFDSDGDGLSDGLESGRGAPLTSPRPGIAGTDPAVFIADANLATRTNPTSADTDGDGLPDGLEDADKNGAWDETETDPLDLDTDDDGLADGTEDANSNGTVDTGETDPRVFDSDGDGLGDGLESGVATPIADPDGAGPLSGTDDRVFRPDADPTTTTDPLNPDSDGDGVSDGDEDWNRDGRFDPNLELDPNNPDSDNDGVGDADEGIAVVCQEESLLPVELLGLAGADLVVALPPAYSERGVLRDAGGTGVGLMFSDPNSGVVGFAISKTPQGADLSAEKQANRNAFDGVANLSNEQDRALISWDGFQAVFTTAQASRGGQNAAEIAASMAEAVAGAGALSGALATPGANAGSFTVYFETIWRTPQRVIVLGALVPAPANDAALIALSDLANGTGVAQFGDFTGLGCDGLQTPEGNDVLDLLWVVDNSCSMQQEQAAVAAAGNEMVNLLSTTQVSWRLALTTTDQMDGSLTARGVAGFTPSMPRMTAETASRQWATAVAALGTGGSGQENGLVVGVAAAQGALPATAVEDPTKFREGASVIVIHMSDEEDFSVKMAAGGDDESCPENAGKQQRIETLTNQYLALQGQGGIAGLTTFAIHGIQPGNQNNFCNFNSGTGDCPSESQHGRAYTDVASATGGGAGSICGDMAQVVQDIVRTGAGIASQFELTSPPISSTIRVVVADENGSFVGQPEIQRSRTDGFDYAFELDVMANVVKHKLVFFGASRPPPNRELRVAYRTWEDGSPIPGGPACDCPTGQVCSSDDNACQIDPLCGEGCPEDRPCNPNTGLCEDPCNDMCTVGEDCVDGICVEDNPCGVCLPTQYCDETTDPPMCRDGT